MQPANLDAAVRMEAIMSTLVLELKSNDMLIINGASIRCCNRVRLELKAPARFLFGRQIMALGTDNTPARRIYYALQTAYIGNDDERPPAREAAQRFCDEFAEATTSRLAVQILSDIMRALNEDRCYDALKLAQRIMRHEDAVMNALPAIPELDAAE